MKKLNYVLSIVMMIFISCNPKGELEGVYVLDKDAFKLGVESTLAEAKDDNIGNAFVANLMEGMIASMEMTWQIYGDTLISDGSSVGEATMFKSAYSYDKQTSTIKFINLNGDEVEMKVEDGVIKFENGETIVPLVKEVESTIDLREKYIAYEIAEEEKRLIEEAIEKEKARIGNILQSSIEVKFVSKRYIEVDYRDYINFTFEFKNLTDRNIAAFRGNTLFKDILDNKLEGFSLTRDDGLKANGTKKWTGSIDYNQFTTGHEQLKNKSMDKIKFEFIPLQILFEDGEKIEYDDL